MRRNVGVVGKQLDAMALDGAGHRLRLALVADDERAAVGQRVQHRVNAPQVVEQEEHERAIAGPRRPIALDQGVEVEEGGLAVTGRAGAEHDEAGRAPRRADAPVRTGGVRPVTAASKDQPVDVGEVEEGLGRARRPGAAARPRRAAA